MKKVLSLLLAVMLLAVCLVPAVMAEGGPSREDMRGFGDIAVPKSGSWLPDYETRYVCSSGGVAAFLFKAPKLDMELYFDDVLEGTELTVLAKENEFYLVKMSGHRLGWILSGRRVWVNERYFIWDGEQFVSRDEYWTPQGMTRFTITLDKAANAG